MRLGKIAIFAALALLSVLHGLASRSEAAQKQKYIFMDEPVAPYTYGPQGGVCESGLTKEILDTIFQKLGLQYELRLVPWARAMDSVKNGDCDGIPMLIRTPEREAFLRFTDPVVENKDLLYYLPERLGDFQWDQLIDLKGLHFGLIRGYAYDEAFMAAVEEYGIEITYIKDSRMLLAILEAGRVDAVIEGETVAEPILAAHPEWARITTAAKPISKYTWRIGVYRNSPLAQHLDAINRALDEMRSDGSLKRILDNRWEGNEPQ